MSVRKTVQRAGGAAARALETCEGAERVAVANMVSSGRTDPVAIAICYNEAEFALPCGICRQVLSEFADQNEDLIVLMAKLDGAYRETTLSNLLPGAFKLVDNQK